MITDENTSSDGDVISFAFKQLGVGTVVGTRTWGGVVGIISDTPLVDGTTVTIPSDGFYANKLGFELENYGAVQDIEVDYKPQDYRKAIEVPLDLITRRDESNDKESFVPTPKRKRYPLPIGRIVI